MLASCCCRIAQCSRSRLIAATATTSPFHRTTSRIQHPPLPSPYSPPSLQNPARYFAVEVEAVFGSHLPSVDQDEWHQYQLEYKRNNGKDLDIEERNEMIYARDIKSYTSPIVPYDEAKYKELLLRPFGWSLPYEVGIQYENLCALQPVIHLNAPLLLQLNSEQELLKCLWVAFQSTVSAANELIVSYANTEKHHRFLQMATFPLVDFVMSSFIRYQNFNNVPQVQLNDAPVAMKLMYSTATRINEALFKNELPFRAKDSNLLNKQYLIDVAVHLEILVKFTVIESIQYQQREPIYGGEWNTEDEVTPNTATTTAKTSPADSSSSSAISSPSSAQETNAGEEPPLSTSTSPSPIPESPNSPSNSRPIQFTNPSEGAVARLTLSEIRALDHQQLKIIYSGQPYQRDHLVNFRARVPYRQFMERLAQQKNLLTSYLPITDFHFYPDDQRTFLPSPIKYPSIHQLKAITHFHHPAMRTSELGAYLIPTCSIYDWNQSTLSLQQEEIKKQLKVPVFEGAHWKIRNLNGIVYNDWMQKARMALKEKGIAIKKPKEKSEDEEDLS